jgi:hypothetical protein
MPPPVASEGESAENQLRELGYNSKPKRSLPCYDTIRNAQKRDKKNRAKQPREEKKPEEKNPHVFCVMSPDVLFWENSFFRVFELLLLRNAQKRDKKIKEK